MNTLIRAAEIWVPDADGYLLEFGEGAYGDAIEFASTSRALCFGRGEGLPGRVWEEGRPILLEDLAHGYFRRAKAAAHAGYHAAVGLPFYEAGSAERIAAVVVLFFGDVAAAQAAVEVRQIDGATHTSIARIGPASNATNGTNDAFHLTLPIGKGFALSLAGHPSMPIGLGVSSLSVTAMPTPRLDHCSVAPGLADGRAVVSTLTLPILTGHVVTGAVAIDL